MIRTVTVGGRIRGSDIGARYVPLRLFTGYDAQMASGQIIGVIELPLVDGVRVFLTAAELRAFADLLDATPD